MESEQSLYGGIKEASVLVFAAVQPWDSHLTSLSVHSIYYTKSQGDNKTNCLSLALTPKWGIRSSHMKLMVFSLFIYLFIFILTF